MSFRGRDSTEGANATKMDLGEPRRFGGMDKKPMGEDPEDRRFDSNRGRPASFGRGRRPSPPGRERPREYGFGRDETPLRDRSPMHALNDRFSDRFNKDDGAFKRDDYSRKDPGRPFYGEDTHRDRFIDGRSRVDSLGSSNIGSGGFNTRFDGLSDPPYKPRSMNYPGAPPPRSYYNEGFPKPNECEIIAVNKNQRAYAESVEARIKEMGVLVDVLFLKDEALLTQTIDDIARRGSLYAMVISPQNETHRSVTVNILHGTPQEHRNMPLEDALKLVARNFHEYIRLQKEKMERERAERGPYVGAVSADREIQFLLRMLSDGRWISLTEITAIIRYLSERRDKMQGGSGDDRGIGRVPMPPVDMKLDMPYKPKDDPDVAQKEQDLQNRIITIMNQGAPPSSMGNSQGSNLNTGIMPIADISSGRSNQPSVNRGLNEMRPQPVIGSTMPGLKPSASSLSGAEENISNQQGLESNLIRAESVNQDAFTSTTAGGNTASNAASTPTFINFDNASVQKALDNLMQSGPNLLKNISMSNSNMSNPAQNSLAVNAPKSGNATGLGPPIDPIGMQRGNVGPPRGPGGMSDMPGSGQSRGSNNLDMGPPRGTSGLGDMTPQGHRGPGSNNEGMMGVGPQRGGYSGMSDIGGLRGFGGNMPESGIGQQRMSDMSRLGGGPSLGIGHNSNFPGQIQFGKYPGSGQQGGFSGSSYNSATMGNMTRQGFGSAQSMGGMGGGPRRY